ncbi:protein tag-52-related [Anaeramoeba flamelloides]|uniref:Protein tag-52-related n=1 Tax=Anaeramoeba flamelloides TaxID=1746091 RepID=A0AAV7YQQ3_9EUKA|nr:protein tag-52-related [Anaeramoeba flamelloides]
MITSTQGWEINAEPLSDTQETEKKIQIEQIEEQYFDKKTTNSILVLQRNLRGFFTRKKILQQSRKQIKRINTILELISTEKTYLKHLQLTIKHFLDPLTKNQIVSKTKLKQMFSNIVPLMQLSEKFYERLVNRRIDTTTHQWGNVFDGIIDFMKIYTSYVNNYDTAIIIISEEKNQNEKFKEFIDSKKSITELENLRLFSLLITPIQRIPRYVILINQIVKNTDESNPDNLYLSNVLEKMKEIAKHLNLNRSHLMEFQRILAIQNKFQNLAEGESLLDAGRRLKKEGKLNVYNKRKKKKPLKVFKQWVFLFNDLLISSYKIDNNTFSKKIIISFKYLELDSLPQKISENQTKFEFKVGKEIYVIEGDDPETTLEWFNILNKILKKNIKKRRSFLDLLSWTKLPVINGSLPPPVKSTQGDVYNNKLYIWGGEISSNSKKKQYINDLYTLDLDTWTWTLLNVKGKKPIARSNHTLNLIDGCFYLFGGENNDKIFGDLYFLDIKNLIWKNISTQNKNKPSARYGHSSSLYKNQIWIFGGQNKKGKCLNDLYCLDLQTNKLIWKKIKIVNGNSYPPIRKLHTCTVINSNLMILGGVKDSLPLNDVWNFDLKHNIWKENESSQKNNINRYGQSAIQFKHKLYIIGGSNFSKKKEKQSVSILNLKTLKWEDVINDESKPKQIEQCLTVRLPSWNNKILLFGGSINNQFSNNCYVITIEIRSKKKNKKNSKTANNSTERRSRRKSFSNFKSRNSNPKSQINQTNQNSNSNYNHRNHDIRNRRKSISNYNQKYHHSKETRTKNLAIPKINNQTFTVTDSYSLPDSREKNNYFIENYLENAKIKNKKQKKSDLQTSKSISSNDLIKNRNNNSNNGNNGGNDSSDDEFSKKKKKQKKKILFQSSENSSDYDIHFDPFSNDLPKKKKKKTKKKKSPSENDPGYIFYSMYQGDTSSPFSPINKKKNILNIKKKKKKQKQKQQPIKRNPRKHHQINKRNSQGYNLNDSKSVQKNETKSRNIPIKNGERNAGNNNLNVNFEIPVLYPNDQWANSAPTYTNFTNQNEKSCYFLESLEKYNYKNSSGEEGNTQPSSDDDDGDSGGGGDESDENGDYDELDQEEIQNYLNSNSYSYSNSNSNSNPNSLSFSFSPKIENNFPKISQKSENNFPKISPRLDNNEETNNLIIPILKPPNNRKITVKRQLELTNKKPREKRVTYNISENMITSINNNSKNKKKLTYSHSLKETNQSNYENNLYNNSYDNGSFLHQIPEHIKKPVKRISVTKKNILNKHNNQNKNKKHSHTNRRHHHNVIGSDLNNRSTQNRNHNHHRVNSNPRTNDKLNEKIRLELITLNETYQYLVRIKNLNLSNLIKKLSKKYRKHIVLKLSREGPEINKQRQLDQLISKFGVGKSPTIRLYVSFRRKK